MGLLQFEVSVRGIVRLVDVPADAARPYGKRIALPVPVHVEVLNHRAPAVPHGDVRAVLEHRVLRLDGRMVSAEHERRALPVEGEVFETLYDDPRLAE